MFALPQPDGGWKDVTASEFQSQVIALAKGLVAAGIQPGDKIGLICRTRYEWTLSISPTWFAGAILVPVYETSSPHQIQWDLSDSGAIVDDHRDRGPLLPVRRGAQRPAAHREGLADRPRRPRQARCVAAATSPTRRSNAAATSPRGSDVATLIYTREQRASRRAASSPTPTSSNSLATRWPRSPRSSSSRTGDAAVHHDCPRLRALHRRAVRRRAESRSATRPTPRSCCRRWRRSSPTFLLAVPRVFEKVYNSAEQKAEAGGRGAIFRRAADVADRPLQGARRRAACRSGWRCSSLCSTGSCCPSFAPQWAARCSYAVSGSAPLGLRLGHFYRSLGIKILEGYGLTETTAPLTVNLPDRIQDRHRRAQRCLASPSGSPTTAKSRSRASTSSRGYWKNPTATKEAFDDGWFKTGDIGTLDEDGYLTITGRKKEIIVTAGGKNVSPAVLEDPIRAESDHQPGRGASASRSHSSPRSSLSTRDAADLAEEQRHSTEHDR